MSAERSVRVFDGEIPAGVGWTALVVSAHRAAESRRPDALFRDPVAELLVSRFGEGPVGDLPSLRIEPDGRLNDVTSAMKDYVAIRTTYFDDALLRANTDGITQIVFPGVGLDGRSFRLDWSPGTVAFELDSPQLLNFREHLTTEVAPTVERRTVAADLREDWSEALITAGFDPSLPSAWLAEGLVVYLSRDANERLLTEASRLSAPGSRFITEFVVGSGDDTGEDEPDEGLELYRELVEEGPPREPNLWLVRHGWTPTLRTVRQIGARVDRAVPDYMDENRGDQWVWLVDSVRE
ncbi:SAM-dependent methyltransferase [Actinoplanes sp. NPDC049596]|uniref:SAM-dependent methyltransferase n=1 Tax=unclassified Actinoplanes TaxID=2626549 RepID=UPI003424ED51